MASAVVALGSTLMTWSTAIAIDMAVVSLAFTYSAAKKAKAAGDIGQAERKQMVRSSSEPLNYIYGKTRSSGVLFFAQEQQGEQDENEWLYLAVTMAGHSISQATNFLLNDEPIDSFGHVVEYAVYPQGRTTVDQYLVDKCKDWSSDMIGKGFAWYRLGLKFDQEKFPTGLPNVTAEKWGWEVPDPRTNQTEWSDNPALCILHFLRHKMKWEDEYLILDSFIDAANICDESVKNPDGTVSKRYTVGLEFGDNDTPASVLDKLKSACGGEWIRVGGRLGLKVAAYYGPAFYEITESDIIGDIELQAEPDRKDSFNVVRGTYVNPDANYVEVDYPEVRVDEWVQADGEEIVMDMDLTAVQDPWQAQRLADIAIKRNRHGMVLKLPCNLRAFNCPPGTMISLSLPTIGFDKQEFIVKDWEYSQENGVSLTVQRDLPSFYDDAVGRPIVTPPLIDLPVGGIAAPRDPHFSAKPVGDVVQGVISWTNTVFKLASTNVILKDAGGNIIQTISVPFPGNSAPLNGKLSGSYTIELQSIGVNSARSEVVVMSINIEPPRIPDFVDLTSSNWSMWLRPGYSSGTTPFGTLFEFYQATKAEYDNNTYPTDTEKADEIASAWSRGGLTPDTSYYYFIRAVNSYGKSDWTKVTGKTTRETGLVETLVEKLIAVEIYSGYIASDETANPAFYLDAANKKGGGMGVIKGAKIIGSEMVSDNWVAGKTGFRFTRDSAEINSDVTIKAANITGTLTAVKIKANQIVGDIVSAKNIPLQSRTIKLSDSWVTLLSGSCGKSLADLDRTIRVSGLNLAFEGETTKSDYTCNVLVEVVVNGIVSDSFRYIFVSKYIKLSSRFQVIDYASVSGGMSIGKDAADISVRVRVTDSNLMSVILPKQSAMISIVSDGSEFN